MTDYIAFTLAAMYAIAAVVRWRALKLLPHFKGWYHASIVCCIASSASFVWIIAYGDSANRLVVVRIIQLFAVPCVYIWPAAVAAEHQANEHRKLDEMMKGVS